MRFAVMLVASTMVTFVSAAPRPHIVSFLVDDLGRYDTSVFNPTLKAETPAIDQLARSGIVLDRFYVYMYCSPTRRSMLSGRFPTSINANQAGPCSNYLPRQMTWISDKLKQSTDVHGNATNSSYMNHFVGKGHLGYPTTDHLPINRGYDSHVGYLGGAEQYYQATMNSHDMWANHTPGAAIVPEIHYSTNYYSRVAVDIIHQHDTRRPLFLDLRYQGVHGPYEEPPFFEQVRNTSSNNQLCGPTYTCQIMQSMVRAVDSGIANVTAALKARGMYDNTLILFSGE